jgi:hypothetical protein
MDESHSTKIGCINIVHDKYYCALITPKKNSDSLFLGNFYFFFKIKKKEKRKRVRDAHSLFVFDDVKHGINICTSIYHHVERDGANMATKMTAHS